ncbi:hypothetical protein RSAG8_02277, partial [Rhizoctonia solani AG-8 WAC10335]
MNTISNFHVMTYRNWTKGRWQLATTLFAVNSISLKTSHLKLLYLDLRRKSNTEYIVNRSHLYHSG